LSKESSNIISIIIVNYKSWNKLRQCLEAINTINDIDFELETIVVDNASNDSQLSSFQKDFPNCTFIENSGNNGFANGCNLGAKNAKGNYLLFLNPDAFLNKEALVNMYEYYIQNNNVGIVSCLQKHNSGYEKSVRFFPRFQTLFGIFRSINKKSLHKNIQETETVLFPDWVSGAAVFISKDWLQKVGFWNEDFWMYYEDVDLSKKVTDAGGEVVLLKNCQIIHNHGGSSRLNIQTANITKGEVIKSKHVYLHTPFSGFKLFAMQFLVVFFTLLEKLVLGLLSIFLLFLPKARLYFLLMISVLNYYISALINQTWLSKRSMNYK